LNISLLAAVEAAALRPVMVAVVVEQVVIAPERALLFQVS
jgi:hypothetical protein